MPRTVVQTPHAPAAIGPYSQAIATQGGRQLFLSGQIPLDPATGELVTGDIRAETTRVLDNLEQVLRAADMTLGDVVRCGIYLTDLADFAAVNEIYGQRFRDAPPARSTVQVAALPRGARVEIDAIAIADAAR